MYYIRIFWSKIYCVYYGGLIRFILNKPDERHKWFISHKSDCSHLSFSHTLHIDPELRLLFNKRAFMRYASAPRPVWWGARRGIKYLVWKCFYYPTGGLWKTPYHLTWNTIKKLERRTMNPNMFGLQLYHLTSGRCGFHIVGKFSSW